MAAKLLIQNGEARSWRDDRRIVSRTAEGKVGRQVEEQRPKTRETESRDACRLESPQFCENLKGDSGAKAGPSPLLTSTSQSVARVCCYQKGIEPLFTYSVIAL
ncbi:hypothetical protein ANO11243_059140 [Dothideomycetidae sp. 11243]|nr:hypothetical protein ANO11243_059140 [fungal sp. No.11243]